MQRALGAKNKLLFINGSLHVPDTDDLNRNAWERCNHLVHSWLINSVPDSIAQTIVFHDNAFDVWEDLKERFSKVDRIRIAQLRSSINSLRQGTKSVLDYFTEMKALWEELHSHRPLPNCNCPFQCRCDVVKVPKTYRVEDQSIMFLTGLIDQFSVVKTQVLLMDPLPSLNKVFSLVIQEESNNIFAPTLPTLDDSNVSINAYDARKPQGRGKGSYNKPPTRHCTFCNKNNHTVDFCYQKHGFPNVNKPNSQAKALPGDVSEVNNSSGLSQDKMEQLVALLQQTNLLPPATSSSTHPATNHISASPQVSSSCVVPVSSPSTSTCIITASTCSSLSGSFWLIDSGANEHICCNFTLFSLYHSIPPVHVTLPNGSTVIVTHAGNINFSSQFYLTNVLYSTSFRLNLMSVAKVCESLSCFFLFLPNQCIIHDSTSLKMIGMASQQDGLYKFHSSFVSPNKMQSSLVSFVSCNSSNNVVPCNSNTIIPNKAIWHFRPGHLSHQRLNTMSSLYSNIVPDNKKFCL